MIQDERTIHVYANWRAEEPALLGYLRCSFVRGQESFPFEYDPAWLASAEGSFSLDPDPALFRGRQYVPLDKRLFGLFADSCPDRWGRLLMKRKQEKRSVNRAASMKVIICWVFTTSPVWGTAIQLGGRGRIPLH